MRPTWLSLLSITLACRLHAQDSARLLILSEARTILPCRIHLKDSASKVVPATGLPFWRDHFVCDGDVALKLAPGKYSYEIERGPEYSQAKGTFVVPQNGMVAVTNQLKRIADLASEGWWSGELHVHRALADIELLMRAEDLHVAPVITWWNNQNLWTNAPPKNLLTRFDKDRFYHVMGGEDERNGGALLYFNLNQPLKINGANREFPSPMQFLAEGRKHSNVWVDIEKPFWYDVPIWLASGMVDSIGIANNHMHRSGVFPGEAWGRARDTNRLAASHGNGFWTQEIYYHALNCGLRLPPSAGSASGVLPNPVGYNRVYVQVDGPLTYEKWWENFRSGRVFVSNGPLLRLRANGQLPGHVFKLRDNEALTIKLDGKIDSRDPLLQTEIIQNGKSVRPISTRADQEFKITEPGWFLVRAIADVPETFRFASTGPFYVERAGAPPRISKTSAQFFLDWVRERIDRVKIDDAAQAEQVLRHHRDAERFWENKKAHANAD
jgi:hypothetical protein